MPWDSLRYTGAPAPYAAASSLSCASARCSAGRARQAPDIGEEFGTLGQQLEQHAPAQSRSDDHVGGGELLAQEIGPLGHGLRHDVHYRIEIPVAQHATACLLLARSGAIDDGRLDAARAEEQPFEINAAARIADRHVELGARKFVGEVGADGRRLGDDDVAVLKCRNLAHRIDRKKFGCAVVTFVQAEQMNVIRFADFLEHPSRDRRARRGGVIERKLRHA